MSVEEQDVVTPLTGGPPNKNNLLVYAAGDVLVWVGTPNVGPPTGTEDPATIVGNTYKCCGWVDTSGFIFKLDETIKDVPAAGTLTPIRSILTGGVKSVQCNFLESLNPYVRSLYDDVPVFPVTTSPLKPAAGTVASYTIPDPPGDNRYAVIFDSFDGPRRNRLWAPFAKVTTRANDQVQQADSEQLDMTFTLYPGTISTGVTGVAMRFIDYGTTMTTYFT